MLHVVLLILKILGIILLSIVFLLLLVVWAVLFVSVTYRIKAEKKDALHVTASKAILTGSKISEELLWKFLGIALLLRCRRIPWPGRWRS